MKSMSETNSETEDDSYIVFADILPNILSYVQSKAKKNNVSSVISAIDQYSIEQERSIIIGKEKRDILDGVIKECNPKTVLELGTFFGYSALSIARLLNSPECIVYTVEISPAFAKIAEEVIAFAGMEDKIKVLVGDSVDLIPKFVNGGYKFSSFDFILLDHWKKAYKRDLINLEELKLIKKGSVILADNVIYPGCPGYLEYVRNNPKYECMNFPVKDAFTNYPDAMEKSVYLGK